METSNDYLLRCAATIKADPNISEDTIILMFVEYKKKLMEEVINLPLSAFFPYPQIKPVRVGVYEVYKKDGKQFYEKFDSKRFVFNDTEIIHWRHILSPQGKCKTI